jgi:hypothetical protein
MPVKSTGKGGDAGKKEVEKMRRCFEFGSRNAEVGRGKKGKGAFYLKSAALEGRFTELGGGRRSDGRGRPPSLHGFSALRRTEGRMRKAGKKEVEKMGR